MTWKKGQRVENRPEFAHVHEGTGWAEKMEKLRSGTIIEVPMFAETAGYGTLLVEWDSLTGQKSSAEDWQMWVHSEFILPSLTQRKQQAF